MPQRMRFETSVACTSTARVLLRIVADMIAPCSVKTYGKYLRRWPRPVFKVAICDLKELVSSAFTVAVHLLLEALGAHPSLRTELGLHDVIGRLLILRLSLTGQRGHPARRLGFPLSGHCQIVSLQKLQLLHHSLKARLVAR